MTMTYPGAVLFDMDGVIFDSEPIHERIFIEFAKELGFTLPPEEYRELIGTSSVSQWSLMKERYQLDGSPQDLSDAKMELYKTFLGASQGLLPIPGICELLDTLTAHAVPFALASSNTTDVVDATLNAIGLNDILTIRIGGNDAKHAKPAPDIFLLAANRLGISPEACVVIEDSTNGVRAAKRANMRCIGFENPNSPGQDLSEADIRLSSLEGLTATSLSTLFSACPSGPTTR